MRKVGLIGSLIAALSLASCKPFSLEESVEAAQHITRPNITISKDDDQLTYHSLNRDYRFDAAFGKTDGPKRIRGDNRTPEGDYYVCAKYSSTAGFIRFLALSYPGEDDAKRGLEQGLISGREYESIMFAHRKGVCPQFNTKLGGYVGIHGPKPMKPNKKFSFGNWLSTMNLRNWTKGCIAVDKEDIEFLYKDVSIGTRVRIKK